MENVTIFRQSYKFFRVLLNIAKFFVRSSLIGNSAYGTMRARAELIKEYSARTLKVLGVTVVQRGLPLDAHLEGLVVCNHLSYLDILVTSSVVPALYITSVETQKSGWVGTLTELAGCLFVERRKKGATHLEVDQINRVLEVGIPVVLYPEATSSDGTQILPFKSSLYQCAIDTHCLIHHFHISFNDTRVSYYGTMEMLPHLWKLCGARAITAKLNYLGEVQAYAESERKQLAGKSFEMIQESHVSSLA